ncbi:hypothetical protein Tco_0658372, partial [Tanacetum coccineum]
MECYSLSPLKELCPKAQCVVLDSRLSGNSLNMALDLNNLLSCLMDDLWASELTISNFSPTDRTPPTVNVYPNLLQSRAHRHETCPPMSEWSSYFDHQFAG